MIILFLKDEWDEEILQEGSRNLLVWVPFILGSVKVLDKCMYLDKD